MKVVSAMLAFLLTLSLMFAGISAARVPLTRQQVVSRTLISLVRIGDENGHTRCSGVVVDGLRGWVLTAEHCVRGTFTVNGRESSLIGSNEMLTMVQIEPRSLPGISLDNDKLIVGVSEVYAFGYGYGQLMVYARIVAGLDSMIVINGGLTPGMSGGPMVDVEGELVGINQDTDALTGASARGTHVYDIRRFMERLARQSQPALSQTLPQP